jgi:mannosylglycoprotein endo-beta-mannosidase
MNEGEVSDIPQVSPDENSILTAAFSEEEVFKAISQMEHNKAPGPDGFPAEFYKYFWEVIDADLMAMFMQLQR